MCFVSFNGSIAYFLLVLNNISLSRCSTVYLSIHLLKNILIASKIWATMNRAAIDIRVQAFVDSSVQQLWLNTKEHDC